MYGASRCLLTGNNRPQAPGASASASDSRLTPPPPSGCPTKHGNTQKTRPLVPHASALKYTAEIHKEQSWSPGRQTPFYILVSFCVLIIRFDASNTH